MDVLRGALNVSRRTVEAGVAAAGAVGGAAVNGVIGGVQGAVGGVQSGLRSGSQSVPAAALTVAVVGAAGAAGLLEWPVLLPIGGTVLAVQYVSNRSGGKRNRPATRRARTTPKGRSGARASTTHTAARSRRVRSAAG